MTLLKNITTGRDNQTHDIARVVMLVNAIMLAFVLVAGVSWYLYAWVVSRPFDVQTLFTAVLTYVGGVGALLTTGAASIYFKRTTEPDGAQTDIEHITKGKQPDNINITNVEP